MKLQTTKENLFTLFKKGMLQKQIPLFERVRFAVGKGVTMSDMSLGSIGIFVQASSKYFNETSKFEEEELCVTKSLYDSFNSGFKTPLIQIETTGSKVIIKGLDESVGKITEEYSEDITKPTSTKFVGMKLDEQFQTKCMVPIKVNPLVIVKIDPNEIMSLPKAEHYLFKINKLPELSVTIRDIGTYTKKLNAEFITTGEMNIQFGGNFLKAVIGCLDNPMYILFHDGNAVFCSTADNIYTTYILSSEYMS